MRLTTSVAVVSLAALGLAACGRGSTSPAASNAAVADAAPGGPGPGGSASAPGRGSAASDCTYISAAQLSAIEGATYAAPTAFNTICMWTGSDGNTLSITLTRNATEADWLSALATVQADQASGPPAPIAGLGDRAAGVGLEIAVQKGGVVMDIRGGDSPGFGKWPKSTAIANAIIAGLH